MQDGIDAERNNFKTVTDRLQFDNNYLRLEIEKMKGLIPSKSDTDGRNEQLASLTAKNKELQDQLQQLNASVSRQN